MNFYFAPIFKYIFLYVLICLLLIAGCWTNMVGGWLRRRRGGGAGQRTRQSRTRHSRWRSRTTLSSSRQAAGRRRSSADRLRFWRLRFEKRLPARSCESPSASHTSGQATADSAGWGEACNFMFFILVHIMCSKS
jgi:hypothetical protein